MRKRHSVYIGLGTLFLILLVGSLYAIHLRKRVPVLPSTPVQEGTLPVPFTLAEAVGQLFIWGIPGPALSSASADLIQTTHPGGVLLTGNFTSEELRHMTESIRNIPSNIPLFIALDQEGGTVKRLVADQYPGGRTLGGLNNEDFCSAIASRSALLLENGVNVNLNIIGDIGWESSSYMWNRAYGNTASDVSGKVAQALACSGSMVTVVKHFPGHGDTAINSHYRIPVIDKDETTWEQEDALPFAAAIADNVDIVMFGHLIYDRIASEPASLSKKFHELLLRQQFSGLTVTDDLGMLGQSGYTTEQAIVEAVEAGNDLLLISTSGRNPQELYSFLFNQATRSAALAEAIKSHADKIAQFKKNHIR